MLEPQVRLLRRVDWARKQSMNEISYARKKDSRGNKGGVKSNLDMPLPARLQFILVLGSNLVFEGIYIGIICVLAHYDDVFTIHGTPCHAKVAEKMMLLHFNKSISLAQKVETNKKAREERVPHSRNKTLELAVQASFLVR